MSEQMRKEFEKFAVEHGGDCGRDRFLPGKPYTSVWTCGAWDAWKAALATQPQAPQGAVTDSERLDFLEKTENPLRPCYLVKRRYRTDGRFGADETRVFSGWNVFGQDEHDTVRAAIDYAINLAAPNPETPEAGK